MIMKKIKMIFITVTILVCTQAMCAKPAVISINDFKGKFSEQFVKTPNISIVKGKNSSEELKIKESKRYCSYTGITLNGFSGMKSIYFSVYLRTVNLAKFAGVYYYWTDATGKKTLTSEAFLNRVSGTSEWTKYEKIISSTLPLKTGGIRINFAAFTPKGSKRNGYALYKDPVIRIATPADSDKIKQASAKRRKNKKAKSYKPTASSFLRGISNKFSGVPYYVERGYYGWFLLWSKHPMRSVDGLKVTSPEAASFELYLHRGKKAAFRPVTTTASNDIKTSIFSKLGVSQWNCWMNVLVFKVNKNAPKTFNISLSFLDKDNKSLYTQSIPVSIIEPLNIKPGKTSFESRVYYAHPFRWVDFDDKRAVVANEILAYLKKRGFSSPGYLTNAKMSPFPVEKGEVITNFGRLPYRYNKSALQAKLLKKHNISMAMGASGMRSDTEFETQTVINNGAAFYEDSLQLTDNKIYQNRELVWINDYEPYAFEGPATKYSYAPESIAAFRKFIKVSEKVKLTPNVILSKYKKQWVKFRCLQHAEVIKAQVDALKKFSPQGLYALSTESLPGKDEDQNVFFENNVVDLRIMDPYVDMHLPMIYARNSLYYRRLEATVTELKKPVLPTITCGYNQRQRDYNQLTRHMVSAAFIGAHGVYHWPSFMGMDANEIQSNQKAMALISRLEPFIKASKLISRKNQLVCRGAKRKDFYYTIRGADNDYMIFMVNDGKNTTLFPLVKLKNAAKPLYISNFIDEQIMLNEKGEKQFSVKQLFNGFRVKLPPESIKIIYCSTKAMMTRAKTVDINANKLEYKAAQAKINAMKSGAAKNGMSYKIEDSILEVLTPIQKVQFDMNNCALGKWVLKNGKTQTKLLDSFARNFFDFPGRILIKEIPAQLENVDFSKDKIKIVVYYKIKAIPYDGLAIRKTFVISRNEPEIAVNVKIIPAGGFRNFAFRTACNINDPDALFRVNDKDHKHGSEILGGETYLRKNTKFTFFIASKHIKPKGVFSKNECALLSPGNKYMVLCKFSNKVEALMTWYNYKVKLSTMELSYDKAYSHNDPHRAKTWECSYTLKALKK